MGVNLHFRERSQRCCQPKSNPPPARVFSEPICQDRLCLWFLIYRWLIFSAWLAITISSFFQEINYYDEPVVGYQKWPIYLTNWDLTLGLSQSLLGVILVTRRWQYQHSPHFDAEQLSLGWFERAYWFLNVATTTLAIGVTVIYWGLVHVPEMGTDVIDILVHVFNTVLMLVDFAVNGVPFELRHCWWPSLVSSVYIVFSAVYYLAGGLDRGGNTYIYPILDWESPGTALLVSAFGVVLQIIMHCLLHLLTRLKTYVYGRNRDPASFSPCNVDPRI